MEDGDEMTEFTPEWIAKARNACIFFGEPATTEFRKALDHIEHLQKRIAELEQERQWIPVSESKPKSGVPVLVWNGGLHTAFWFEQQDDTSFGGHWVWHPVRKNIYTFMLGVTHWQPLPQPPKDGE